MPESESTTYYEHTVHIALQLKLRSPVPIDVAGAEARLPDLLREQLRGLPAGNAGIVHVHARVLKLGAELISMGASHEARMPAPGDPVGSSLRRLQQIVDDLSESFGLKGTRR